VQDQSSNGRATSGDSSTNALPHVEQQEPRQCPWCGSRDTDHTQRGFVGRSNDRDQYLTCRRCRRLTWEIVSRTPRDIRMGQFRVGDTWRDHTRQTKYVITRILKVGVNEILLYVKPIVRPEDGIQPVSRPH
jgi:RNA polymerase subunit RPABC4/transcription elongation factor Spt4